MIVVVLRRRSFSVLLIALAVMALGACSGDDKKAARTDEQNTQTAKNATKQTALKIGNVKFETFGPMTELDKSVRKAVLANSQKYVDAAILTPLDTGKVGDGYSEVFDGSVRESALGKDRGALTEEAMGEVDKYEQNASPVTVSGLADNTGTLLMTATQFVVLVQANTPEGNVAISHDVELTFSPVGKEWRVTAYRTTTVRKLPNGTTTTVATQGSAP
jgi:hypothetical protein